MKFITPIILIRYGTKDNAQGDTIKDPENTTERKVYSNKLSVGQKEFYQAQATGMKPEIKFEIRRFEYKGEDTLKYNNIEYRVIRTFENEERGTVELTCSRSIRR
jgi:SPP1 family predicted phage head-tail adaptor